MPLYIGLMSGTSLDGVEGVLVRFEQATDAESAGLLRVRVLAHAHAGMPAALGDALRRLNAPGPDEIHQGSLAANALARLQADVVRRLLDAADLTARQVRAVGSHGQTVRHRPGEFDGTGYTCQLNAPALLAELCGIDVAADFRSRDVAAGGQGAPLAPAFHQAVFGGGAGDQAVLNVGGMANLTLLGAGTAAPRGFDCGPGNVLMDAWCVRHTGQPYDRDGAWAAGGTVRPQLLSRLLADPYFAKAPPKSTGRDLFDAAWLDARLDPAEALAPQDVQATLLELTVRAALDALRAEAPATRILRVCGGGAFNGALMARLAAAWPGLAVSSTAESGLPPQQVEAAAFAWLAARLDARLAGNAPTVTGARGPRLLGGWYPA